VFNLVAVYAGYLAALHQIYLHWNKNCELLFHLTFGNQHVNGGSVPWYLFVCYFVCLLFSPSVNTGYFSVWTWNLAPLWEHKPFDLLWATSNKISSTREQREIQYTFRRTNKYMQNYIYNVTCVISCTTCAIEDILMTGKIYLKNSVQILD